MNWEELAAPFRYDYMLTAMGVCALVSALGGLLSCFVTLKGWSLLGDALSHAVVPGVAIAHLAGWPLPLGAFTAGLGAVIGIDALRGRAGLKEDAVIGVIFTGFFAAGLYVISTHPAGVDLKSVIFGNILAIDDGDLSQLLVVAGIAASVLALKWRDLLLFCFDPAQARALGLPVRTLRLTLLALLSAVAVAAMQTVGACLVVATLITPGATAHLLTDRFGRMLGLAAGIGASTGLLGAYASYHLDGSTGGCIVTLQTLTFLAAFLFAPKHGLIATKRRSRFAKGEV